MSPQSDALRSRWRRGALGVGLLALAWSPAPAVAQDSADAAVEAYLQTHGLDAVLAAQLRDRFEHLPAADRAGVARRLADLYRRLIEHADGAAERARWERAARDMLARLPDTASASLRLSLERARYAQAESALERARLLLADEHEAQRARSTLTELAPVFQAIARTAHDRVLAIHRQEESGRPFDADLLGAALAEARRDRSLGFYLAGWSNVYLAESTGARTRAADALPQFGWLLGADLNEAPDIARVPARTLAFEHVARSAIGVALAHAALGDEASAAAWLDLVDNAENAPAVVRRQIPARRLIIMARFGRWERAAALLRSLRRDRSEGALRPTMARLAAVLALAGTTGGRSLAGPRGVIARDAVADLVEQGEIGQIVDLASRFGAGVIAGREGFIGSYVRGLLAYESARSAHRDSGADPLEPTADTAIARGYIQAADLLRAALRDTTGAGAHPATRASAATLAGSALYLASGARPGAAGDAVALLELAAGQQPDRALAADALWLALRAARRAAADPASDRRSSEIAQRFLERFPDDQRAGVLRVELAAAGGLAPEDAVVSLLDTPRDSPAYDTAQRHAARLLYDLYRSAPTEQRDWSALRYAEIAEPLVAIDRARAARGDAGAARLASVRARRLLDALLSVSTPDGERASAALASLDAIVSTGLVGPPPEGEILLRRVQVALALGDDEAGSRYLDDLRDLAQGDPSATPFLAFADRAVFDAAVRRFRRARAEGAESRGVVDAAQRVIAAGAEALAHRDGSTPDQSGALPLQAAIAEAAESIWRLTGDENALELAFARRRLILDTRPGDRESLRSVADLAEARGDRATARSAWRTLSAGLEPESAAWYEARVRLMELLADDDPERAVEALVQHLALHATRGPEPWASRLDALARRLKVDRVPPGAPG